MDMIFKAILLGCSFVFVSATNNTNNDNLVAVLQIFRHGARTPIFFYPTDPYQDIDKYWEGVPIGELTNEGKRQLFELGELTRKRYSGWLPERYSKRFLHVQTTDIERTHMSAQSFLYGLFPATGNQVWRTGEHWQPIPVHIFDIRIIDVLGYNCTAFMIMMQKAFEEKEFQDLDRTYADVYEFIGTHAKINITNFFNGVFIFDPLHVEFLAGLKLPSWTSKVYPEPLTTLATKALEIMTYTRKMQRLATGPLFNNIIEYFEAMVNDPTSAAKYQVYSAHDINVFSILNTIGHRPSRPVPFGTSLWFELRKINDVPVVNLWMKSDSEVTQLSIGGCPLDCPLTSMKTHLSDLLIDADTFETECSIVS